MSFVIWPKVETEISQHTRIDPTFLSQLAITEFTKNYFLKLKIPWWINSLF
jgi:hypothetical protein